MLGATGLTSYLFNPLDFTCCRLSLPTRHPTCPVLRPVLVVPSPQAWVQTRESRGSVTTPVIDICRPARSSVERQSCMAEPHRPPEAYLSTWQSSYSIRVVSTNEDALWRTGLHRPSDYAISAFDLEAQSWKSTVEKRNGKAESSRPLSVELPISPPPSYSQIDRSVLVSVP